MRLSVALRGAGADSYVLHGPSAGNARLQSSAIDLAARLHDKGGLVMQSDKKPKNVRSKSLILFLLGECGEIELMRIIKKRHLRERRVALDLRPRPGRRP